MSKVIEGVIDLPEFDPRDLDGIFEMLLFLEENEILEELKDWVIEKHQDHILIKHKDKMWTWIKLYQNGTVKLDNHYGITEEFKDKLFQALHKYYPMYRKAIEVLEQNNISQYKMHYNRDTEKLVIEIEEV